MEKRKKLSKSARNAFLSTINYCFELYKIDLIELKSGGGWNEYRQLRPVGGSCNCWGGTPEEEERYHEIHIERCLTYVDEMQIFVRKITDLIKVKREQLKNQKLQAIKRIKEKDIIGTCFDYSKHAAPINKCTNSEQLAEKEAEITQEIEKLSNQAQADEDKRKKQEEENERLRKEEEERQQKHQKNWEEEQKKMEEEFKKNQTPKNSEDNKKLNDLKNKFYELYQKGKKYSWIELTMLLHILSEIGKETILDNDFLDAKTELQIIQSKLAPYRDKIAYCQYLILEKEENLKDKPRDLIRHELEDCKKAFEEVEKIVYLTPSEENLLKKVNEKLKELDLEAEIEQLKNNKTENPQQQKENQKKIAEKQKELEKLEENKNISKEIANSKQKISQMLGKYKLKVSNLPKKCWNWEKELENFSTKEQIKAFIHQLEKVIKQQIDNKQVRVKQNKKPLSLPTKILLGLGISILIVEIVFISSWVIKRRKLKIKRR